MRHQIPNALTLLRLLLVPIICLLLFLPGPTTRLLALLLFALASISDFLDGYLARRWQATSDFGRLLDPIADKLLILAVLYALAATGELKPLALAAGLIILIREVAVTGLREFLAARQIKVATTWVAKWKATVQMLALLLVMLSPLLAGQSWQPLAAMSCDALMLLAAALTLWSGVDYFAKGWKAL